MSTDHIAIINTISQGLNLEDMDKCIKLVQTHGLYGAARIIGYDVSHYDNLQFAGRLAIQHLKETTPRTIREYAEVMQQALHPTIYQYFILHHAELQAAIDRNAALDYDHDWFSANSMITMYSAKPAHGKEPMETPQYTWMRMAVQFYHTKSLADVLTAYEDMARGWYTPASPTIFNAGMCNPQMSSCFLLSMGDDLEQILTTGVLRAGLISKSSGGLGIDVSRVRHSEIGQNGWSDGIIPMLRVVNDTVRYVNQSGHRKGAATVFLRPHHLDVEDFIQLPQKVGDPNLRAHDINVCLWTSWVFWDRIRTNGKWTLFCPARTTHLNDLSGEAFTKAYLAAEEDTTIAPHHKKVINARDLFNKILSVQRETGMPYLMNGDAANIKSNHRHMGYIRSSNLCLEIIEFTDDDIIASCNLHSISLRMFAKGVINRSVPPKEAPAAIRDAVDFVQLGLITGRVVRNLNAVIDQNWYPLDKIVSGVVQPNVINKTNKQHRPIGIGAAGFAEMLHILDISFQDPLVSLLNKMVFACMYWNALAQSVQLAINDGSYASFHGSPTSTGKLQFDLWKEEFSILGPNAARKAEDDEPITPDTWGQAPYVLYKNGVIIDTIQPTWDDMKCHIIKHGLRNSLLLALMPTASTAQIRRNCETVEAHQTNMYSRKVLKCAYPVLNRYLVSDLEALGVWNSYVVEYLRVKNGSIQGLTKFIQDNPNNFQRFNGNVERLTYIEKKYLTMWEIPQRVFLKLAAERGRYIDQSASTNIYIKDCTNDKLSACHLYANMLGLKTIMYYLRQTGGETIKFTADPSIMQHIKGIAVELEGSKLQQGTSDNEQSKIATNPDGSKVICTDEICMACQ
jgi:ribonucleoside-diphosphate reductase alpha subunit